MENMEYLRKARSYYLQYIAADTTLRTPSIEDVFDRVLTGSAFLSTAYKYLLAYIISKTNSDYTCVKKNIQEVLVDAEKKYTIKENNLILQGKAINSIIDVLATSTLLNIHVLVPMLQSIQYASNIMVPYLQYYNPADIAEHDDATIRIVGACNSQLEFSYIASCGFVNFEKELFQC